MTKPAKKSQNISTPDDVTQETENEKKTQELDRATTSYSGSPDGSIRQERLNRSEWFRAFRNRHLDDFLILAIDFNFKQQEQDDRWHSSLYWFFWLIRGHADLSPYINDVTGAANLLGRRLSSLSKKSGRPPTYGFSDDHWYDWLGSSEEEAIAELYDVWRKARFLPGHDPLEQAADAARRERLKLRDEVLHRRPIFPKSEKDYLFFVSLAANLQVAVGPQPIKLPQRKVGETMGVSPPTIGRYCRWAMEDGYLTITGEHVFRSKGESKAREYRFDLSRFHQFNERMPRE